MNFFMALFDGGKDIIPLTREEALLWLEERGCIVEAELYFSEVTLSMMPSCTEGT